MLAASKEMFTTLKIRKLERTLGRFKRRRVAVARPA
jgi:hypothetical protein